MIRERDEVLDLHELARQVGRLVPSWTQPQRFYRRRDALADALHRIARNGSPEAPGYPTGQSEEERRLAKLLLLKNDELARVRRQLVEAARARPRRRQPAADHRQFKPAF